MKTFRQLIKRFLNFLTGVKPFKNKLPPLQSINKILIISLYFKGDFLFHTAFIEALTKIFPNSKIDVWVKERASDIIHNDPRINRVHIFNDIRTASYRESTAFNLKGKLKFLRKLRREKYDLIFDLTGKYSTALFALFSSPRYSAGINYNFFGFCYDKFISLNTYSEKGHLIEKYLAIIPLALQFNENQWQEVRRNIEIKPYIYIEDEVKEYVNERISQVDENNGRPLIAIHATSGWKAKELNAEIFAELVRYFNKKGYNYVFIGDFKDRIKIEEINSFLKENELNIDKTFLELTFIQSAELIRRSSLLIGSDSAPLHIAGAVGTPSIGIFGPTNPEFSKPVGDMHRIIYHRLYCSASEDMQYCTRNAGFTCATIDCMKLVKVEEIIRNIESLLENERK